MIRIIAGVLAIILSCMAILQANDLGHSPLFKVERSKNANIIQYDAQIGPNGKLDRKKPVNVYWVRLAEQGQIKPLSWIQKKFAYGFKVRFDHGSDSVIMDMAADIGQPIRVERDGATYRAVVDIGGTPSRLIKVFINATDKGFFKKVNYVEFYGTALATGEETYIRFVP